MRLVYYHGCPTSKGFLLQARDTKGLGGKENRYLLGSCWSTVRNVATFQSGPRHTIDGTQLKSTSEGFGNGLSLLLFSAE